MTDTMSVHPLVFLVMLVFAILGVAALILWPILTYLGRRVSFTVDPAPISAALANALERKTLFPHPNCKYSTVPVADQSPSPSTTRPYSHPSHVTITSVQSHFAPQVGHIGPKITRDGWRIVMVDDRMDVRHTEHDGSFAQFHGVDSRPEWPILSKWLTGDDKLSDAEWAKLTHYGIQKPRVSDLSGLCDSSNPRSPINGYICTRLAHGPDTPHRWDSRPGGPDTEWWGDERDYPRLRDDAVRLQTELTAVKRSLTARESEARLARIRELERDVERLTRERDDAVVDAAEWQKHADRMERARHDARNEHTLDRLRLEREVADRDEIIDGYHQREARVRALLGEPPILLHLGDVQEARDVLDEPIPSNHTRCTSRLLIGMRTDTVRCVLLEGHSGSHTDGHRTWW